jgi:hypothetical protein
MALSMATLVSILWINWQIADHYNSLGIKDQRLFGWTEYLSCGYKYYLLLPGLAATVLASLAVKRKEAKHHSVLAITTSLIAIASIFIKYWIFISVTKTFPLD